MKNLILLFALILITNAHAAKIVTIDEAKYVFNVTHPTVNLESDDFEQQDHESDHDYCVRDNIRNGYSEVDSNKWCQKRSWEK